MKSDIELHKDVVAKLTWDPHVSEKEIGVAVKEGVVTLTGSVKSSIEKSAAQRVVEGVDGVKAVANDLAVNVATGSMHTDTEIAHDVVNALEWDLQVPQDRIKVTVVNGWLKLEGEVDWTYQRDAAARAVRFLPGVNGVANNIKVTPKQVSTYEVTRSIKEALERRADRTADRIDVDARDGVVTLTGTVASYGDRRAAEGAAWSTPGVKEVRDELTVVF